MFPFVIFSTAKQEKYTRVQELRPHLGDEGRSAVGVGAYLDLVLVIKIVSR